MTETTKTAGPVDCPRFNVNGFQVLASSTEVTILCLSQVAGLSAEGEIEAGSVPAVQFGISPAVAKELYFLLGDVVKQHEAANGEISTEYLRSRKDK